MIDPDSTPDEQEEALEIFRQAIARVYAEREKMKLEMEVWYEDHPGTSFPGTQALIELDDELSDLDDRFKELWDQVHRKPNG